MKRLNKKGLFSLLITLIVVIFLSSATVSAAQPERLRTALAIEVGSSATRLSVIGGDNSEPKIISIGPGTRSSTGPLESNWTTEGFLLIKAQTKRFMSTHPTHFSTLTIPLHCVHGFITVSGPTLPDTRHSPSSTSQPSTCKN
ncbi:hypothetical protein F5H01DRAFT_359277 [Linnemannia elongata]|nr:hypothetical protein F5H01DRAFT_359277 [Linnemannia elongata]